MTSMIIIEYWHNINRRGILWFAELAGESGHLAMGGFDPGADPVEGEAKTLIYRSGYSEDSPRELPGWVHPDKIIHEIVPVSSASSDDVPL